MTITMQSARTLTIAEMQQLTEATGALSFQATSTSETYRWLETILGSVHYRRLKKGERSVVRAYVQKLTGYSKAQLDRLIARWRKAGRLILLPYRRHTFSRRYTDHDITLLAETDEAHGALSGPATRKILQDEYHTFHREQYEHLSEISPAHIYNLRRLRLYRETNQHYQRTKPTSVAIGERRKPDPSGRPGFLRVDSVHAGDSTAGGKGVYYINLVDEVLQWEVVLCVEKLSERYLKPALQTALALLPFVVSNIHADNGSEYINQWLAGWLNDIQAGLTKSRPRHSNDNALAETKNGSVVRKHLGYGHVPEAYAPLIQRWCLRWLNPYLNFHRPCGFPKTVTVNKYGKTKTIYPIEQYATPYERFKSLPNPEKHLKVGLSFAQLDRQAYAVSHTEFAKQMNAAKRVLLQKIKP